MMMISEIEFDNVEIAMETSHSSSIPVKPVVEVDLTSDEDDNYSLHTINLSSCDGDENIMDLTIDEVNGVIDLTECPSPVAWYVSDDDEDVQYIKTIHAKRPSQNDDDDDVVYLETIPAKRQRAAEE